ncbi:MAG: phage tail tape measure protein, partial [Alphaproteobacteria bacterium]|nr:phage tail tape measure protein [Alphaproteobacteria bacterium]
MATLTAIFQAQDKLSGALKGAADQGSNATSAIQKLGKLGSTAMKGLTVAVGAISTALGFLAKSIITIGSEFETAFQGVVKTVDFTGANTSVEEMRSGLIDLSTTIPITAAEFSEIAAAAGQLGISTDSILAFSETMANLGVATNLTSDEAATALAQFANVMQMAEFDAGGVSNYSRLGSTIVALGNNFATTEADIVNMAQNLASVGKTTGMSEHQIMAFATAMSSVGIEAAAGGTSMSTFASDLQLAVETGSKSLSKYAKVAGMSSKEFQTAFKDDAAGAITAFIGGLNDMERNGGKSAVAVLDELGIKETRMRNMLLALANSGDLLNETMATAAAAWEENAALSAEAESAYATFANQSILVKNKLMALGIAIYDSMREPLGDALDVVSGYMDRLRDAFEANGFDGLISEFGKVMGDAVSRIVAFTPQIVEAAISIIYGIVDAITDNLDIIAEAAVEIGITLAKAIVKIAPRIGVALLKAVGSAARALFKALPRLFKSIPNSLYEGLGLDKNTVVNKIRIFSTFISSAIRKIFSGDFLGAVTSIGFAFNIDTDTIDKIKNAITTVVNALKAAWNAVAKFVKAFASIGGLEAILAGVVTYMVLWKAYTLGQG